MSFETNKKKKKKGDEVVLFKCVTKKSTFPRQRFAFLRLWAIATALSVNENSEQV